MVLTSKHHDGYALWPSKYSYSWNSVDVGPHRNIIAELSDAIRTNTSLKFGLYHSLYEWFNPMYLGDKQKSFSDNVFVVNKVSICLIVCTRLPIDGVSLRQKNDFKIQLFHSNDLLWLGLARNDRTHKHFWTRSALVWWRLGNNARILELHQFPCMVTFRTFVRKESEKTGRFTIFELFHRLYNDSPVRDTVVTNDRWGRGTLCKHGDFITCSDRFNPGKFSILNNCVLHNANIL